VRFVVGDPLGTPALEQQSFYLRHPGIDVIHLRADPRGRLELTLIGLILVAVSLGLPAAYLLNGGGGTGPLERSDVLGAVVAALVGSGLGLGFLIPGLRGTFSADVIFDRPARTIRGRCWRGGRWRRDLALRFDEVESVQVCSRQIIGDEHRRVLYVAFELNLVLTDDAATRTGLGSHGDEAALMADADKLAEFLGCGVIDDRGGEIPGVLRNPRIPRP
jgi:hypothetical protein